MPLLNSACSQGLHCTVTLNTELSPLRIYIKEVILCFLGFAFPLLCYVALFLDVKGLQRGKARGNYSLPQKTLLLHCLTCMVWSQAFMSITYLHHYVTGVI